MMLVAASIGYILVHLCYFFSFIYHLFTILVKIALDS